MSKVNLREEFQKESDKRKIAKDIMDKKTKIDDLSDKQIEEMIDYFKKYINEMDTRISEIKRKNMNKE